MKNQGGLLAKAGKVFLILLFIAGFFYLGENCWAAEHIVISEIQITGGAGKTENDFIELYNPTDASINLKGYRLVKRTKTGTSDTSIKSWTSDIYISANGYYLWANSNYMDIPVVPNATTTGTISSDNGVALRFGAANTGEIVDSIGWGEAQNVFVETAAFQITDQNVYQSIERKFQDNNYIDTNNNNADFFIQENPNPQNSGESVAPPPPPPAEEPENPLDPLYQGEETATSTSPAPPISPLQGGQKINLGDVVINEFVSDPADGEVEWIELYNATGEDIDLVGWTIEEGSGAKTSLSGALAGSGKEKFFIVEKPKGNLNNNGDIIILRDKDKNLIDQVTYGNWDDGDLANNAPATSDPDSLARKFDGYNTFNNLNDFAVTTTPTKGTGNIITAVADEEEEISAVEKALYDFSDDIIISEIFPDPIGRDNETEFIELYNKGEIEVNLLGWGLGDDSKTRFKFKENILIKGGQYLAIFRPETKIALNNGGDSAKLFQPLKDEPCQTIKYEKAIEGWSYNFATSTRKWIWSEVVTPAEANIIKTINHPPLVSFSHPEEIIAGQPIIFDSSDTVDEDGDELKFSWDFGDGIKLDLASPEHTYLAEGSFLVKLAVSDGTNEVSKEEIIRVVSLAGLSGQASEPGSLASVIINEILPDPEGADAEGEWIELKNTGDGRINLLNWQIDDAEGGSRPYKISSDLWLFPGDFYLLERSESGLALNNTNDSARLFNNLEELVDEVSYEKSFVGESYARAENGKWFWTTILTPGEENVISVAGSKSVGQTSVLGVSVKPSESGPGGYIVTSLEKIKEFESGDLVRAEGTVAVLPGILGAQYFYIVGSPGIQVYNYNKDFPNLKIGDYLEVSGEISISGGEQRIKTKTKEDMKIIENRGAPAPAELAIEKITEEYVGSLVSITGEVVDRKSSIVYLDDGTEETRVYIKGTTGINIKEIKEGEILTIAGIVSRTESGLRIMPRSPDDIIRKDIESQSRGEAGQVLGEVAASNEWAIAARDKKLELFKYLLVLAGGIIIVLGGLLIKELRRERL
ncbi:MAG: lamin tail domain-containing protein [Patescibacteria group bacterium]|nr:lamin tail domain-containing protein [Patescibacteria group bacterium]